MKDGIKQIVGKTIAAVVVASNSRRPHYQIFLVFDDETSFEIFGDAMTCASGLNPWGIDRVLRYAKVAMGASVNHVYLGKGPSNAGDKPEVGPPRAGEYLH